MVGWYYMDGWIYNEGMFVDQYICICNLCRILNNYLFMYNLYYECEKDLKFFCAENYNSYIKWISGMKVDTFNLSYVKLITDMNPLILFI